MKILHMCLCGPYTDNWSYQDNLLPRELQLKGTNNTVLALMSDYEGKYSHFKKPTTYFDNGVKIIRILPTKKKIRGFLYLYNVYKFICAEKPDCIFVHCIQTCSGLYALKYKHNINQKCILLTDNHADFNNSPLKSNIFHKFFYSIRKRIVRKCCNEYDAIWGITPECCDYVTKCFGISSNRVSLLPLGHSINEKLFDNFSKNRDSIRESKNIPTDGIILITGGKIEKRKKTLELIQAFKKVNRKNIYLFIFGRIENDYLNMISNEIGTLMDSRIFLLGELSVADYTKYLFASDVAVFPGGQSVLWQQAIGCGLPLIVDKNQNVNYLDVGGNVLFSNDSTSDSIKSAIEAILEDKAYLKMKSIAKEKGREYFSYKRIADIVLRRIEEAQKCE